MYYFSRYWKIEFKSHALTILYRSSSLVRISAGNHNACYTSNVNDERYIQFVNRPSSWRKIISAGWMATSTRQVVNIIHKYKSCGTVPFLHSRSRGGESAKYGKSSGPHFRARDVDRGTRDALWQGYVICENINGVDRNLLFLSRSLAYRYMQKQEQGFEQYKGTRWGAAGVLQEARKSTDAGVWQKRQRSLKNRQPGQKRHCGQVGQQSWT